MKEKILKLMEEKNITAYRLSKEIGISQATLSNWKRRNCLPRVDVLKKLADYFGVTVDYFLE